MGDPPIRVLSFYPPGAKQASFLQRKGTLLFLFRLKNEVYRRAFLPGLNRHAGNSLVWLISNVDCA